MDACMDLSTPGRIWRYVIVPPSAKRQLYGCLYQRNNSPFELAGAAAPAVHLPTAFEGPQQPLHTENHNQSTYGSSNEISHTSAASCSGYMSSMLSSSSGAFTNCVGRSAVSAH